MKELEVILKEHARRYGQMQPTDAVKLVHQNEFGGGHLIRDQQAFRNYLHEEYARIPKDPSAALYEDIGNQIVRVNLAAMAESQLEKLAEAFAVSAEEHQGSLERFRQKLEVLRRATAEGIFAFSPEELQIYLKAYEADGFPMVSHSQQYRDAYHPAYRIISKTYLL